MLVVVCLSVNVALALFICVCLKSLSHLKGRYFTRFLAVWAHWPLITWITYFQCAAESLSFFHVDVPAVCLWVCLCVPWVWVRASHWWNCVPLLPLLLLLMLSHFLWAPPTNPPNREKIERFIGAPVRTPPGFMANRQRLSLGGERRSKKGCERE